MPSRNRRRRPGRRRAAVLHPTRPRSARPAARPQRSKRPTASRKSGIPHEFRDSGAHGHVLEHCALPGCTAPPRFARVDARYCTDAHRLKHWREGKRAARATAPRLPIQQPHDADHADVDPGDMPEPENPEGIAAEYQQLLALAREIVHQIRFTPLGCMRTNETQTKSFYRSTWAVAL